MDSWSCGCEELWVFGVVESLHCGVVGCEGVELWNCIVVAR